MPFSQDSEKGKGLLGASPGRARENERRYTSWETAKELKMRPRFQIYLLLFIAACSSSEDPAPDTVNFDAWTNPVTGAVVTLPTNWRHSPDTAAKGQTVVGYFVPRFAWMKGEYGHVSLHHEDLSEAPPTIEDYTGRLERYLHRSAESITQTVYAKRDGLAKANFEVETVYNRRRKVLRCLIWTRGDGQFWYAITELLADDRPFIAKATPVVDLLVESTVPRPAP